MGVTKKEDHESGYFEGEEDEENNNLSSGGYTDLADSQEKGK